MKVSDGLKRELYKYLPKTMRFLGRGKSALKSALKPNPELKKCVKLMGRRKGKQVYKLAKEADSKPFASPEWSKLTREARMVLKEWLYNNYDRGMYQSGALEEIKIRAVLKSDLVHVFSFWYQGWNNAPMIVQKCHEQVEKLHLRDDEIELHFVDKDNIGDYIGFPNWVQEKVEQGIISLTEYGNLVRLALLYGYGGVWMDATVFLSKRLDIHLMNESSYYSVRQRERTRWNTSFLMCNAAQSSFAKQVLSLYMEYWKEHNAIPYYYIFDVFIDMVMLDDPFLVSEWSSIPINNPHYEDLCPILNDKFEKENWDEMNNNTSIYKLSYKAPKINYDDPKNYYSKVVAGNGPI